MALCPEAHKSFGRPKKPRRRASLVRRTRYHHPPEILNRKPQPAGDSESDSDSHVPRPEVVRHNPARRRALHCAFNFRYFPWSIGELALSLTLMLGQWSSSLSAHFPSSTSSFAISRVWPAAPLRTVAEVGVGTMMECATRRWDISTPSCMRTPASVFAMPLGLLNAASNHGDSRRVECAEGKCDGI